MGFMLLVLSLIRILRPTHDVGVVARVGIYGRQGVIPRDEQSLGVGAGGVAGGVALLELERILRGGEGGDVEGAHAAWGHELAAHLVGDDAHVEAEVDLDAGVQFEF